MGSGRLVGGLGLVVCHINCFPGPSFDPTKWGTSSGMTTLSEGAPAGAPAGHGWWAGEKALLPCGGMLKCSLFSTSVHLQINLLKRGTNLKQITII